MDSAKSIKYSNLKLGKAIATKINAGPTVQISSISVNLKNRLYLTEISAFTCSL